MSNCQVFCVLAQQSFLFTVLHTLSGAQADVSLKSFIEFFLIRTVSVEMMVIYFAYVK